MKGRSFSKATAILAGVALLAAAGVASAQVDKDNAKCRSSIFKTQSKLAKDANKAVDKCWKDVLKGKRPAGTDCNDPATADTKGKIGKDEAKLLDTVGGSKSKCDDTTHAAALAMFPSCPSPASATDDGGATTGIDGFAELGPCQVQLAKDMVAQHRRYIMQPNAAAILALVGSADKDTAKLGKQLIKCAGAISKNASKLYGTVGKERGKDQASSDKAGGPYGYGSSTADPKGKIAKAISKFNDGIDKSCALKTGAIDLPDLALIGACGTTLADIKECVVRSATKSSSGLTAAAYEIGGVCPTIVEVTANAGSAGGGRVNATRLDTGYTGLGHNVDVVDGFVGAVNLACSDGDCGSCAVTVNCSTGSCRCSNDPTIACTTPFAADSACGGNICDVHFGPPLALSAGGTGTCVVNKISQEISGTADVGTGSSNTTVSNTAKVFLMEDQLAPCPVCDAGASPSVGDSGTCTAGPNVGNACTVNAIHPTFGASSYDCPPDPGKGISGTGLKLTLTLDSSSASLSAALPCAVPGPSCPCAVCTGDSTLPCTSDSVCAAAGAGTCTSNGGGAQILPNSCGSLTCTQIGSSPDGECTDGTTDSFCDGALRGNGEGFISCSSNGDCTPSLGGGTCSQTINKRCFLDPITATGQPGQDGAVLVSTFCAPPTTNVGVNLAGGAPGPGRISIDWDFNGLCSDGVTPWELGGANCP